MNLIKISIIIISLFDVNINFNKNMKTKAIIRRKDCTKQNFQNKNIINDKENEPLGKDIHIYLHFLRHL